MMSDIPSDVVVEDVKAASTLPMRKRKKPDDSPPLTAESVKQLKTAPGPGEMKPIKRAPMSKAREIRLEQNRKAARESRRRKKVMIEELQRSVIFFSRANGTLKQQNDELSRLVMQAQAQVNAVESGQQQGQQQLTQQQEGKDSKQQDSGATQTTTQIKQEGEAQAPATTGASTFQFQNTPQQAQAQAVATQAMYESQGFPAAAARTAAHTITASGAGPSTSGAQSAPSNSAPATAQNAVPGNPPTGATMQVMANFQQAAAAAVQAAMAMTPGAAGAAPGSNPSQAYTDSLNAFAMQHAAAAAAGQTPYAVLGMPQMQQSRFVPQGLQFGGNQQVAWQQQQAMPAATQPAAAAPVQQNVEPTS